MYKNIFFTLTRHSQVVDMAALVSTTDHAGSNPAGGTTQGKMLASRKRAGFSRKFSIKIQNGVMFLFFAVESSKKLHFWKNLIFHI